MGEHDNAAAPAAHRKNSGRSRETKPRFGVLLGVCLAAVVFCGVLVWFAGTYLQDCCTFDFFTKLGR